MIVLGIDVGASGALATLISDGELIEAFDMPCLNDGPAGRRAVPLLARARALPQKDTRQ